MTISGNLQQDIRVSRAFEWIAGVGGSAIVLTLAWIGSTLLEVRESTAVIKVQIAPTVTRMDRIEGKVEDLQSQVSRVETKVATMEARQQRVIGQ